MHNDGGQGAALGKLDGKAIICLLYTSNEGIFWGMGGFKEHDRYWNCDAYPTDEKDLSLIHIWWLWTGSFPA